jgi:hypothetical protein
MKRIAFALMLSLMLTLAARAADNEAPAGFTPVFNGKDLANFKADGDKTTFWTVKDGVLDLNPKAAEKKGDKSLQTAKSYKNFVLMIDWRWSGRPYKIKHPVILPDGNYKKGPDGKDETVEIDEAGDSGVYLRGSSKAQVNFWCWPIGSGEVYGYRTDAKQSAEVRAGVTPKKSMDKPMGEWNKTVITLKGDRLTVNLNGEDVIVNAQLPGIPAEGPLVLQDHGNPIQFKNIYIKELE